MLENPLSEAISIVPIAPKHNADLARIIRTTLEEFGANRPGTVYFDKTTDDLYALFSSTPGSAYFVAEKDGKVLGGGGIYPTEALPPRTCELVKMYLLSEARGQGLGRLLIGRALDYAKDAGYEQVYLETMPELKQARHAYAKFGFEYLDQPTGASGHFGCDLWMLKKFTNDDDSKIRKDQDSTGATS